MQVKSVNFTLIKEEWYYYELEDGSIFKVKYILKKLFQEEGGKLRLDGNTKCEVTTPPERKGVVRLDLGPVKFVDPHLIQAGRSSYVLENGKTLIVRPRLRQVVRVRRGTGYKYTEQSDWMTDWNVQELTQALTRKSTFSVISGDVSDRNYMVNALSRQKEILEWLFFDVAKVSRSWFTDERNKNHPAVEQWSMCKQLVESRGLVSDNNLGQYSLAAKTGLDAMLLVKLSEGDLQALLPGSIQSFGDTRVQQKFSSRIADPDQFGDLSVELYTAGWHKTKGRIVKLLEFDRSPDVVVEDTKANSFVCIECKRLRVNSITRLQKDIQEANKQLKNFQLSEGRAIYNAVLLDVTSFLTSPRSQGKDPDEILQVIEVAKASVSGDKNSHVKSVIIVWDDYDLEGKMPDPVLLSYNRRARIIHHEKNASPLEADSLFDGFSSRSLLRQVPDEFLRN